jgi:hypothetical protein
MTARPMFIDRIAWTDDGPRVAKTAWDPVYPHGSNSHLAPDWGLLVRDWLSPNPIGRAVRSENGWQ